MEERLMPSQKHGASSAIRYLALVAVASLVIVTVGALYIGSRTSRTSPRQGGGKEAQEMRTPSQGSSDHLRARKGNPLKRLSRRGLGHGQASGGAVHGALKPVESGSLIQSIDDLDLEGLERSAIMAFNMGRFDEAIDAYKKAIDAIGQLLPQIGDQLHTDPLTGKTETWAETYQRLKSYLAETMVQSGDLLSAEILAREVLAFDPNSIEGRHALSEVYLKQKDFVRAEALYEEVLWAKPDDVVALNNLGVVNYMERNFEEAEDLFLQVLDHNAGSYSTALALSNASEMLLLQGNYEGAEGYLNQATEIYSSGSEPYYSLSVLYDITGRTGDARETMSKAMDLDMGNLARNNSYFVDQEWEWYRDALVREVQGDNDGARNLWRSISTGSVDQLREPARRNAEALEVEEME